MCVMVFKNMEFPKKVQQQPSLIPLNGSATWIKRRHNVPSYIIRLFEQIAYLQLIAQALIMIRTYV